MANAPFVESPQYTALALGYKNPEYLADLIMPSPGGLVADTFSWDFFSAANFLSAPANEVGRTGSTPTVRFLAEQRTSFTKDYGYQSPVPRADQDKGEQQRSANYTSYDPKAVAADGLTELLMLAREVRVASLLGDIANHGRVVTLTGTDVFDNGASPIQDIIEDARNKMPLPPTHLITNALIGSKIRTNANVVEAVRGTGAKKGNVSASDLAELFELDQVLLSRARFNPGQLNDPAAASFPTRRVFGNWIALLHINPLSSLTGSVRQTWGMTARSKDKVAFEFFDPNQGVRGADILRVGEFCREVVCAPICGTLILNVLGTAEPDFNMSSTISSTSASAAAYSGV
jgi:hypothetical protein